MDVNQRLWESVQDGQSGLKRGENELLDEKDFCDDFDGQTNDGVCQDVPPHDQSVDGCSHDVLETNCGLW